MSAGEEDVAAAIAACDGTPAAMAALRRAVAADAEQLAAGDARLRRVFWRTVEVIDTIRRSGVVGEADALYRIFVVNRLVEGFARGNRPDAVALERFHRRALALAESTPPGSPIPGAAVVPPPPVSPPLEPVNRIGDLIAEWETSVAAMTIEERDEATERTRLGRSQHGAWTGLASWARRQLLLTEREHATMASALGSYRKDAGGWPAETSLAARLAVTEVAGELHAAASRSAAGGPFDPA